MTKEQHIEDALIDKLRDLKYTYRPDIRNKSTLEGNFRKKFESLNRVTLTDGEFARLRDEIINADVFIAAQTLRERNTFIRDDGTPLQYTLVNVKDWCKNDFEVINQLRINTDNSYHRYDVIILLNGIPVVQIELKNIGVNTRRAMEQIVEYKNDPGNGYTNSLLCFMQLFIVSNCANTWYFANNQNQHFGFDADERFLPVYQFADKDNNKITKLHDFSDAFLAKCTLAKMISRYMVLVATEKKLMMMRPYQIYAVQEVVSCIHENRGNGYIWHTTGSGKTLTSFKASTLLKDNPDVDKCLFVVDRKDLDRQTREEFNKFQAGCVEENTNTETLVRRLLSEDYADKVIVTTIQKLGLALDENSRRNKLKVKQGKQTYKARLAPLHDKRMVFIFDECHRSQFGENHKAIKHFFPHAQLFGFTGTPIFDANATVKQVEGEQASYKTTEDIFQKQLHAYTISHAINDDNVLRFHIDYFAEQNKTEQSKKNKTKGKTGKPTPTAVVNAILDKHDAATGNRRFNAVFATQSINDAINYYDLLKQHQAKRQAEDNHFTPLNIACVFSPPAEGNKDTKQLQEDLPNELRDNKESPDEKKAALKRIIADYNKQYNANHSISEFDSYYQDIQQRIKDHKYSNTDYPHCNKIDVIIVVDMLLTGFDSKYLNTLYVDKKLQYHGLIQAFSRTNRILNDTKPYGNVLDFRGQKDTVDEAIALFSGQEGEQAREIWLVEPAPIVIEKLNSAMNDLKTFMTTQGLTCTPQDANNLKGDTARIQFINCFKEVQRLKIRLDQYTDLNDEHKTAIDACVPQDTLREFKGVYLETAGKLKARQGKRNNREETAVDQLNFELVLFTSNVIDFDYITSLMADYTTGTSREPMTREQIISLLLSDANLMEEHDDLTAYINTLEIGTRLNKQAIREGFETFQAEKSKRTLKEIAQKHKLSPESLQRFVDNTMARMILDGDALSDLLAPLDLGWRARVEKEQALMEEVKPLLEKQAEGREIAGLKAYE